MKKALCLLGLINMGMVYGAETVGKVNLPTELADPSSVVTWAGKVKGYCEGPAGLPDGSVIFSDGNSKQIRRVSPEGVLGTFANIDGPNGNELGLDGKVYACARDGIYRFGLDGGAKTKVVDFAKSPSCNDLTVATNGDIYFTNWGDKVYYWKFGSPANNVKDALTGMRTANGIEYIEESKTIYVNESLASRCMRYTVSSDGVLTLPTQFGSKVDEADGITYDELGNLYAASYNEGKILVFNPKGELIGNVHVNAIPNDYAGQPKANYPFAGSTSNCAFGGKDFKTLYITGDGGLYAAQLKVAGRKKPNPAVGLSSLRNKTVAFVQTKPLAALNRNITGRWVLNMKRIPVNIGE